MQFREDSCTEPGHICHDGSWRAASPGPRLVGRSEPLGLQRVLTFPCLFIVVDVLCFFFFGLGGG